MTTDIRPRLLTGDRPTGAIHLGHYLGTLKNRVRLQHEYQCFFIVADLHMLTTRNSREDITNVATNARGLVLDALAAGIEPDHGIFYLQSAVPEIHEIAGLLQSLVTVARLERLPSLKDMARDANIDMNAALLNYPVLQSADILSVRANAVPVGKDNFAFVEVCREIARRFNHMYGEIFPIPNLVTSDVSNLIGTDGSRKMSKSLGNAIFLRDNPEEVRRKVRRMYTDPNRIRADIPGSVEGNPVFSYLDAFGTDIKTNAELKQRYQEGRITDMEVKVYLAEMLNGVLEPMRERRAHFGSSGEVDSLLVEGTEYVRREATYTVRNMKRAMGIASSWNSIRRKARH